MNKLDIIINYELSTLNEYDTLNQFVKKSMLDKEYFDRFTDKNSGKIIYLPNGSLWKKDSGDIKSSLSDLVDCLKKYNDLQIPVTTYNVKRYSAFEFNSKWHAIFGEPYKIECTAPIKQ